MRRRTFIKESVAAIAAMPFVNDVKAVSGHARALIITIRDGWDWDASDAPAIIEKELKPALRKAGLEDVEVIVVQGMDVTIVDRQTVTWT